MKTLLLLSFGLTLSACCRDAKPARTIAVEWRAVPCLAADQYPPDQDDLQDVRTEVERCPDDLICLEPGEWLKARSNFVAWREYGEDAWAACGPGGTFDPATFGETDEDNQPRRE